MMASLLEAYAQLKQTRCTIFARSFRVFWRANGKMTTCKRFRTSGGKSELHEPRLSYSCDLDLLDARGDNCGRGAAIIAEKSRNPTALAMVIHLPCYTRDPTERAAGMVYATPP